MSTVAQAVDTMPPALKVLADQRRNLTRMLTSLSKLGTTGTRVINASRDDVVANLTSLRPILQQLNKAGNDLPNALELMTTYPFPRNVTDAIKGDYVNLKITADLDLASVYGNLGDGEGKPNAPGKPGVPELPGAPELPEVPGVPLPRPSTPTAKPGVPGGPSAPADPLCPPVCTSGYASYDETAQGYPPGVDLALAELMLKGMQP